ncbi:MAG: hypothetical protein ACR2N1_24940 [Rubripirellula sp.]
MTENPEPRSGADNGSGGLKMLPVFCRTRFIRLLPRAIHGVTTRQVFQRAAAEQVPATG